jgi:hypothetical protein
MKLESFELLFEDVQFYPLMQRRLLCNSIYNRKFMRKLKRGYLILEPSMLLPTNVTDEARLQAAEPYKTGQCATVVYKDHTSPWAEFSFTYKSMSLSIHCDDYLTSRFVGSVRCHKTS